MNMTQLAQRINGRLVKGVYWSWQDATNRDIVGALESMLAEDRRNGCEYALIVQYELMIDLLWTRIRRNEARNRFLVRGITPDNAKRDDMPLMYQWAA